MNKKVVKKAVKKQPSIKEIVDLPKNNMVVLNNEQKQNFLDTVSKAYAFVSDYSEKVIKGQLTGNLLANDYDLKKSLEKVIDELEEDDKKSIAMGINNALKMKSHPDIRKAMDDIFAEEANDKSYDGKVMDYFGRQEKDFSKPEDVIHHYYVRNEKHQPIGVVALCLKDGRIPCRGISICSLDEPFLKKDGIAIAVGRVKTAMINCFSSEPMQRVETGYFQEFAYDEYLPIEDRYFKAGYNVVLSEFEQQIVKSYRNERNHVEQHDFSIPRREYVFIWPYGNMYDKIGLHTMTFLANADYVVDPVDGVMIKNRKGSTSGLPTRLGIETANYMFLMIDYTYVIHNMYHADVPKNAKLWNYSNMIINLDTGRVVKNIWGLAHGI
jgi:hypothetical protein